MDEEIESAFVNEIAQSQLMMRSYLAKLLANSISTDDVLQEANKVLWIKRSDWDPETPFMKWAYRICYFQAKAFLRDSKRERLVFREDLFDMLAAEEPRDDTTRQRERALLGCLKKLRSDDREVLLRRYEAGESVDKLAVDTGVGANTLSQRLRRIRVRLHDCVRRNLTAYSV